MASLMNQPPFSASPRRAADSLDYKPCGLVHVQYSTLIIIFYINEIMSKYCVQKVLRVLFEKNGVRWWSRACYQTVQRRRTNIENFVSCLYILDCYSTENR